MELTCWWNQLWIIFMNMKSITARPNQIHQSSLFSLWEWEKKWKDWLNLKGSGPQAAYEFTCEFNGARREDSSNQPAHSTKSNKIKLFNFLCLVGWSCGWFADWGRNKQIHQFFSQFPSQISWRKWKRMIDLWVIKLIL